jgi:L-asparaginase
MQYDDRILGGSGAHLQERMVLNLSTEIPQRRAEYEAKLKTFGTGTVGCVLDSKGKLLLQLQQEERVLKSGTHLRFSYCSRNYANEFCGVSLTGVGEDIVSNATATKIVTRVTDGFTLQEAL